MSKVIKTTEMLEGDVLNYYHLIGTGIVYCEDVEMETIIQIDKINHVTLNYNRTEFFEMYGGYHFGTEDVTIEDVIRREYVDLIGNTDFAITKEHLLSDFENVDLHLSHIASYTDNMN